MPNVMGRKFPYTPKGEQDAEDYGKSVAVVEQTMPGAAEGVKRRAVERLMEELKARRNRSLLGRSLDAVREGPQGEAVRDIGGYFSKGADVVGDMLVSGWDRLTGGIGPERVANEIERQRVVRDLPSDQELTSKEMEREVLRRRATGMRDGGMMGFRPLGYKDGAEVRNPSFREQVEEQERERETEDILSVLDMGWNPFTMRPYGFSEERPEDLRMMSEISVDLPVEGVNRNMPLIVPETTGEEIVYLASMMEGGRGLDLDDPLLQPIYQKAIDHYRRSPGEHQFGVKGFKPYKGERDPRRLGVRHGTRAVPKSEGYQGLIFIDADAEEDFEQALRNPSYRNRGGLMSLRRR